MFDKDLYRSRCAKNLRGQGDPIKHPVTPLEPEQQGKHVQAVNGQLMRVNRAQSRRRVVDRKFTKRGYAYGRAI